ncbi:MAG TPA: calcium-binding protein [Solirubrobacterales bacterium]|nr:calcium-binding protein [Solirubrobacterales bacterium]
MATAAKRRSLRALPALAVAVTSLAIATAAAQGATVAVSETLGEDNFAELSFQAAPGEDNRLTITFVNTEDGWLDLTVKDDGAPLAVGAGCAGGGAPGQAATCRMQEPRASVRIYCGKMCEHTVPGTSWYASMRIALGDGDNSFDGGAFSQPLPTVAMEVDSGAGDDKIVLGSGADKVDPGGGSDQVDTGPGSDRIETTAAPDGPDIYDAGASTDTWGDTVSYERRSVSVQVAASIAGAAGEGDALVGGFRIYGGMADDVLAGGPADPALYGGPGNDVLSGSRTKGTELHGGPGDDQLSTAAASAESYNKLVGGDGDDTYVGGEGSEEMLESYPLPNDDDLAYGGGNDDTIILGGGSDQSFGGPGDDAIDGQSGRDSIHGGLGQDLLVGGYDFDRIFGGRGSDRLFSGRTLWDVVTPSSHKAADDSPDRVDCGPGRDFGYVNPWDRRSRCEKNRLLRRLS